LVAELFHVGLTVAELDRSVAFYRDVVGLEVLSTVDVDSEGFRRLTANSEATLRTSL
jgi:catechol 2,3-dioxygenase-like lactoylglutathione lyase family enzyme